MQAESKRRNFDVKAANFRFRESGRTTTVVVGFLALAAVTALAFALMEMTAPRKTTQENGHESGEAWQVGVNKDAEQNQRSIRSTPESRHRASRSTRSIESRVVGGSRSDIRPSPSVANREDPSWRGDRQRPRPRPKDTGAQTDRRAAEHRYRDDSRLEILEPYDEFASEDSPEEVSDPLPGFDLDDEDFLEGAADNWGYEELPPRFANQAGLEEGFLVVGFDGEFVHGPESLRSKASRPDQPDPVAIDVWNPWTGEQVTLFMPLHSVSFSELPE